MPGPARPDLSVVVPVYRGAAQVEPAVARLVEGLAGGGVSFEVVLVDDGSDDGSYAAMVRAASADGRVRAVRLERNSGKGAAVAAGMAAAAGRVRAFTDVDVPYGVEPVLAMHREIAEGRADVAVGDRNARGSGAEARPPLLRRVTSLGFACLVRLLAPCDTMDTQCGVKAFDGDVAAHLFPLLRETGFAFDAELLFLCRRHGLRVARTPVRLERIGPSSVSVLHVALPMLRAVAKLRGRWRRGEYRCEWLDARRARGRTG